jgi:hypothetical protein
LHNQLPANHCSVFISSGGLGMAGAAGFSSAGAAGFSCASAANADKAAMQIIHFMVVIPLCLTSNYFSTSFR